jgi:F-type H+-transporting ATPase subunit delta
MKTSYKPYHFADSFYDFYLKKNKNNKEDLFLSLHIASFLKTNIDFVNYISNSFYDKNTRLEFVKKVLSKKIPTRYIKLINLLIDLNFANKIIDVFISLHSKIEYESKIINVELHSAFALTPTQMKTFNAAIVKKINKKIFLNNIINKELIGGIKIVSNEISFDNTILNALSSYIKI